MKKEYNVYHNKENSQFEILEGDHRAEIVYRIREGVFYIMHTAVPEPIAKQGIGGALALHTLKYGQQQGLELTIYCPFVKMWVKKNPNWKEM